MSRYRAALAQPAARRSGARKHSIHEAEGGSEKKIFILWIIRNELVSDRVNPRNNFFFISLLCFVTSLDWNSFGCLTQVALGNFLIHKLSGLCFFFLL